MYRAIWFKENQTNILMESETEHWFCLRLCHLWSSENCIFLTESETEAEAEEETNHNAQFQALWWACSSTSAPDSDNLGLGKT